MSRAAHMLVARHRFGTQPWIDSEDRQKRSSSCTGTRSVPSPAPDPAEQHPSASQAGGATGSKGDARLQTRDLRPEFQAGAEEAQANCFPRAGYPTRIVPWPAPFLRPERDTQAARDDCERIQQHALAILQQLALSRVTPPADSAISAPESVRVAADSSEAIEQTCSIQIRAVHPVSDSPCSGRSLSTPRTLQPGDTAEASLESPSRSQRGMLEQAGAVAEATVATGHLLGDDDSAMPQREHVRKSVRLSLRGQAEGWCAAASHDSAPRSRRATSVGKASQLTTHPTAASVRSSCDFLSVAMDRADEGHVIDCMWGSKSSGISHVEAAHGGGLGSMSSPGSGQADIGAGWSSLPGNESDNGSAWTARGSCTSRRISFARVLDFTARSSRQV